MRKSDLIKALEQIQGDPEVKVDCLDSEGESFFAEIDRVREFPTPTIYVTEK